MADSVQPGCFLHTAGAHESGHVSSLEFFQRTLRHLGPTATRVHHSEDNQPPEETLSRLFWKGRFGPVAAAIKLCGSDPCAPSVNRMFLMHSLHISIVNSKLTSEKPIN